MPSEDRRKVGKRGQVTIPQSLRKEFGIQGGDEVVIRGEGGKLVIERPVTKEDLAEGYRDRAERSREIAAHMQHVSAEANDALGDAPEW